MCDVLQDALAGTPLIVQWMLCSLIPGKEELADALREEALPSAVMDACEAIKGSLAAVVE